MSIEENYKLVDGQLVKIRDSAEIWHGNTKLTDDEIKEVLIDTQDLNKEYGITLDNVASILKNYEIIDGQLVKIRDSAEIWFHGAELTARELKDIVEKYSNVEGSQKDIVTTQYEMIDGIKVYTSYQDDLFASTEKTAGATKDVGDEAKKVEETFSDLAKHEMSLEAEKFKSDLELIEIKAQTAGEVIKTSLEWEAKLDIAALESDAKIVEAVFGSIADSVQSSAEAAASMFDSLAGASDLTGSEFYTLAKLLEDQMTVQDKLADSQIKLTNAQAELLEAQADSIRTDGVKINVTIQGNTAGWLSGLTESLLEEIFVQAEIEGFQCFGV